MSCVFIFFSVNVNIFNKKFENFEENTMKIESFSNIAKYSFNNLLVNVSKIKNIFIYYKNDVNKIKTCF